MYEYACSASVSSIRLGKSNRVATWEAWMETAANSRNISVKYEVPQGAVSMQVGWVRGVNSKPTAGGSLCTHRISMMGIAVSFSDYVERQLMY